MSTNSKLDKHRDTPTHHSQTADKKENILKATRETTYHI